MTDRNNLILVTGGTGPTRAVTLSAGSLPSDETFVCWRPGPELPAMSTTGRG